MAGQVIIEGFLDIKFPIFLRRLITIVPAIAVIATPASVAQGVADVAVDAGVGSILNFAPTSVTVPPHVALRQVDLGIELQILSFYERQHATANGAG